VKSQVFCETVENKCNNTVERLAPFQIKAETTNRLGANAVRALATLECSSCINYKRRKGSTSTVYLG
jgi:hypothetical protein